MFFVISCMPSPNKISYLLAFRLIFPVDLVEIIGEILHPQLNVWWVCARDVANALGYVDGNLSL